MVCPWIQAWVNTGSADYNILVLHCKFEVKGFFMSTGYLVNFNYKALFINWKQPLVYWKQSFSRAMQTLRYCFIVIPHLHLAVLIPKAWKQRCSLSLTNPLPS